VQRDRKSASQAGVRVLRRESSQRFKVFGFQRQGLTWAFEMLKIAQYGVLKCSVIMRTIYPIFNLS